MTEPVTAMTRSLKNLKPWVKGQSGNPGGKSKRLAEFQALTREHFALANKRLGELLESGDKEDVKWAIAFTFTYTLGKPWEGRDLLHLDAQLARRAEVLAETVEVEEPAPPAPELPVVVTPDASPPLPSPESTEATDSQLPPAGTAVSVPSGLRCLYRDKQGQCAETAPEGKQWCGPHQARLFALAGP